MKEKHEGKNAAGTEIRPLKKLNMTLVPLIIYFAVSGLTMVSAVFILQAAYAFLGVKPLSEADTIMLVNILGSVTAAIILSVMYLNDWKLRRPKGGSSSPEGGEESDIPAGVERAAYPVRLPYTGLLIAAGILTCIFGNYFINIFPLEEMSESFEDVNNAIGNSTLLLSLTATVITAPFVEELLVRGLVYRRMRDFTGVIPAALCSAFIFGIIHMNIVQGVYAFIAGLVFAFIYERYQSLAASIVVHAAANLGSVFIGFLFALTGESAMGTGAAIAVSLPLLLAVCFIIYKKVPHIEYIYIGKGDRK